MNYTLIVNFKEPKRRPVTETFPMLNSDDVRIIKEIYDEHPYVVSTRIVKVL